jgi:hypothetical protein
MSECYKDTGNIMLKHPFARHLLLKSLIQPSYMEEVFLKLIQKFLHITLHVSTDIGDHQAFKIVDEHCCASVL